MKNLIFIIVSFTIFGFANVTDSQAQTKSKGQLHFEKREYSLAITEFEKELKDKKLIRSKQSFIEGHIGISYYYLNHPKDATDWIKKSISSGYRTAHLYFINGLALQKQEKYEEATVSLQECLNIDPSYSEANIYIRSCEYALSHPDPNEHIKLNSSKINTDGSEYGISPADGEIFFSRASTKGRDIDPRTGLGFTEIYSAKLDNNELVNPQKEKTFMKTFYNTGVFAYDSLTNYLYLTMCDPKSGRCGIYRSKFNRKKWEEPEPFFINTNYDMAHPALAKNGTRLYFSSNAPGGYGKTDIWYADRVSENEWSEPVNLGDKINTSGREEFPYIENDNILYFSSDGHPGFGGLDIFFVNIDGDEFSQVNNLGRPFNSGADDFNLITFGEKGLLVSSRNLPKNDDIYIFDKKHLLSPTTLVEKDKKDEVLIEVAIETEIEEVASTDTKPEIISETAPKPETKAVSKPEVERPVKETGAVKESKPKTVLTTKPQEGLATFYYDFNLFVPQRIYREMYENIALLLKNQPNAKFVIEGYADDQGNTVFNIELSEKRAQYIYDRLVDRGVDPATLTIKGFGNSQPAVPNASTEKEYQLNRRVIIRVNLNTN